MAGCELPVCALLCSSPLCSVGMRISGIDANLLIALNALLTERNVTRAAARLGVGQPTLSHSLARLRAHFKDPLLIQRGRGLYLSERVLRLGEPVAAATA